MFFLGLLGDPGKHSTREVSEATQLGSRQPRLKSGLVLIPQVRVECSGSEMPKET